LPYFTSPNSKLIVVSLNALIFMDALYTIIYHS